MSEANGWFTPEDTTCSCGRALTKKDVAFRKDGRVVCRHCPDPAGPWVLKNMAAKGKPMAINYDGVCARCGARHEKGTTLPVWGKRDGGAYQITGCKDCLTGAEWKAANGGLSDDEVNSPAAMAKRMGGFGRAWTALLTMAEHGEEASLTSADVAFGSRDVLYTAFRELALGDPNLAKCSEVSWLRAWSQCCAFGILPSKARGADGYLYYRGNDVVLHISYHAYVRMAAKEGVEVKGQLIWGCMMTLGTLAFPAQEATRALKANPKGSLVQRQRVLAEGIAASEERAKLWRADYEARREAGATTRDDELVVAALDLPPWAGAWFEYPWYHQRDQHTPPVLGLPPENLWPMPEPIHVHDRKDGPKDYYAVRYAPVGVLGTATWQTPQGRERRWVFRPISEVHRNAARGGNAKLKSDGTLTSAGTYFTDYSKMVAKSGVLGLVGAIPTAPLFSRVLAAGAVEEQEEVQVIDATDTLSLAQKQTALLLEANDEATPDFRAMADGLSAEREAELVRVTETPGPQRDALYAAIGRDWSECHPGDWPDYIRSQAAALLT